MKNMTLKEIAVACGGIYYGDDESYYKEVSSVVIDSRKVEKDCLFIAIRGARVDGHMFIPQTIRDGALCALATGSVGKTSTKEMIASVLGEKYNVLKTAGNFNNEIGLPLTIFNIREEHEVAVLELGISNFGEMERLAKIARPDICVITNIGVAHLEHLKSRDGILKAKTEIFLYMNPNGSIILNGDDDKLSTVHPANGIQPVFFGLDDSRDFYADQVESCGLRGTNAVFHTPNSTFSAHISIPGEHMVLNALAGIAAGYALGMNDEEIKAGIEALVPLAGRNNLIATMLIRLPQKHLWMFLQRQTLVRLQSLAICLNWGRQKNRCTMRSENMLPALESIYLSASDSSQNIWQPVQVNSVPKHRYFILKQKMTFSNRQTVF